MMLKLRLILLNFIQFFIWGSWLITVGVYWFETCNWSVSQFGLVFSTMGISSLFMPAIAGIIADKWLDANKLLGIFHLLGAVCFYFLPEVSSPNVFLFVMMTAMLFYMPTISLSITVSYSAMNKANLDVVKHYPPIRVFGTIGFIAAMWTVNLFGWKADENQFLLASGASLLLGLYSFSLPTCPINKQKNQSLKEALGFDAFKLFKRKEMAIFFIFSLFLGAALQLTNAYGDAFLNDFSRTPEYKDLWAVTNSTGIMSISQISETLFILTIPFFLRRFGIKKVMALSMFAWVFRFGLFAFGNPSEGLWMIILSCIIYGMAFDFFNISGSLYVEQQTSPDVRASGQGLFMMMTNGFGAILGSWLSGVIIDVFFILPDGSKDWRGIWLTFASYALVVAVTFIFSFPHSKSVEKGL